MRYGTIGLAAFIFLVLAASASGGKDGSLDMSQRYMEQLEGQDVPPMRDSSFLGTEVSHATPGIRFSKCSRPTPDWLVRGLGGGPDIRAAGDEMAVEQSGGGSVGERLREGLPGWGEVGTAYAQPSRDEAPPEGGIDGLILEATEHWGVEWAAEALAVVRFRESSNQLSPCVVGASGERGPYQFLPSTWATTPYASLDPCDLKVATYGAAWMVKEGRQHEFHTWPR